MAILLPGVVKRRERAGEMICCQCAPPAMSTAAPGHRKSRFTCYLLSLTGCRRLAAPVCQSVANGYDQDPAYGQECTQCIERQAFFSDACASHGVYVPLEARRNSARPSVINKRMNP